MMNLKYCQWLFAVLFAGSVLTPSASWGYEEQARQSIAYDGSSFLASNYDFRTTPSTKEHANGFGGTSGLFAKYAEFLAAKTGPTVFRQGTFADEAIGWEGNYVKGKYWATDNPLTTPGYAKKYGLPAENTGKPDWVVGGNVQGNYTTRPAPEERNVDSKRPPLLDSSKLRRRHGPHLAPSCRPDGARGGLDWGRLL